MELDTIGDEKTVLFLIMSDTDTTFNFILAMLQSQLINLLCDRPMMCTPGGCPSLYALSLTSLPTSARFQILIN